MSTPETHPPQQQSAPPPPDPLVSRIATGALGFAVVAFVIGLTVDVAVLGKTTVPNQLWVFGNTLAGALLGLLAPSPAEKPTPQVRGGKVSKIAAEVWKSRVFLSLLVVFIVSAVVSETSGSKELLSVAGAAGGALLGVLAPSPRKT